MKRILALLLAVLMLLSLAACGETVANEPPADPEEVVILYTNDIHTYIDKRISYDVLAGLKAELQKQNKNVLLVDAGDHVQGTAYGSLDKGESIIKLMNAAKYDVATLGNHEFDYGMAGCIQIRDWAEFPYVSANFYTEENGVIGANVLDAFKIFEFGGTKIAIVGITTPDTFTKTTPAYFQDENGNYIYGIAGGDDGTKLYEAVQKAVDDAKAAGATKVIALGHLGIDESSRPWTSKEVIANVSGLDAFIDGHSHNVVESVLVTDKDGKEVPLTQTGEYFENIGMMVIAADGTITTDLIYVEEIKETSTDADGNEVETVVGHQLISDLYTGPVYPIASEVATIKDGWVEDVDAALGQKIGTTDLTFDNYDSSGNRLVRKQETNTGDFAADALYYLFDNMDMDVDVAVMNGGGIRNKAVTGDLTYKVAKNIHTFGNVACLQTITGQQLLDALEWGARDVGEAECGGFLHVAGITYKIDTEWPTSVQKDDKGVWTGAPTGGYRVHDVKVYNKETGAYEPLDLNAKYNLAGYNYTLRDLGDGFNMFSGAVNVLDYVMEDYMVLANYIEAFGGEVGATNSPLLAKYGNMLIDYSSVNGSGRIVNEAAPR